MTDEGARGDRFGRRRVLALVFATALALVYLESVLFHALLFLASYVDATMAIPLALLGLSIGGLVVYLLRRRLVPTPRILAWLTVALALSFPLVWGSLVLFSSASFANPWALLVPFALGSVVLSLFFVHAPANEVYLADLAGAGAGAALSVPAIEHLGVEGALFLGVPLVALPALGLAASTLGRRSVATWTLAAIAAAGLSLVVHQARTDAFDFAYWAVPRGGDSGMRPYTVLRRNPLWRLVYTRSSVSGRTDAIGQYDASGRMRECGVYHDGQPSDSFKFLEVPAYELDPRVPRGFARDPDTLILGTSAEGIVNAVAGMGDGEIDGVEIAAGKVDLMVNGIGKELSHDAYRHIDRLAVMDGRTYLNLTRRRWDHITLMNAHLGHHLARASAPEYLHTLEAIETYLGRLTDRGMLNIEEVAYLDSIYEDSNLKLVATLVAALRHAGARRPGDHLYLFRWTSYLEIFAKRTPFTEAELEWLDDWRSRQDENQRGYFTARPGLAWHPRKVVHGRISDMIGSGGHFSRPGRDYRAATDDRPFPLDALTDRPMVRAAIRRVALFAGLGVIVPIALVLFIGLGVRPLEGTSMFLYFGGLGIAYLLIEVMLMQRCQLYVGSPGASVVAILGGMLVASGLGALSSARLARTRRGAFGVFGAIGVLAVGTLVGMGPIFAHLPFAAIGARMLVAVAVIAPLSFFMGMPFPIGLTVAKARADAGAGALLFGVNGAFSAIATPISVVLSMDHGFSATLVVGAALYGVLGALLALFWRPA